jgi:twinkle protein
VLDEAKLTFISKDQRGVSSDILDVYGIQTKVYDGEDYSLGYPWSNGAVKERIFNPESRKGKWRWKKNEQGVIGQGLFGIDSFEPVSKSSITIVEGLHDAPALYQAIGGASAVVAVNSSSSAVRDVKADFEKVNAYDRVILCFDNDDAGRRAALSVSNLFDPNKVFEVKLSKYNDPAEYVENGDMKGLAEAWADKRKYTPETFIHTFSEVRKSLAESVHDVCGTYPLPELQTALRGLVRGEVTVFKGLEGIGKTEVFRAFEYHLLKTEPDTKMALIHMEEDKSTTVKGIATYEAGYPMYFEEDGIPEEEVFDAYKKAVGGREDRVFIYRLRGSDEPDDILDAIRSIA